MYLCDNSGMVVEMLILCLCPMLSCVTAAVVMCLWLCLRFIVVLCSFFICQTDHHKGHSLNILLAHYGTMLLACKLLQHNLFLNLAIIIVNVLCTYTIQWQ